MELEKIDSPVPAFFDRIFCFFSSSSFSRGSREEVSVDVG